MVQQQRAYQIEISDRIEQTWCEVASHVGSTPTKCVRIDERDVCVDCLEGLIADEAAPTRDSAPATAYFIDATAEEIVIPPKSCFACPFFTNAAMDSNSGKCDMLSRRVQHMDEPLCELSDWQRTAKEELSWHL
jgi:hypothetical protein